MKHGEQKTQFKPRKKRKYTKKTPQKTPDSTEDSKVASTSAGQEEEENHQEEGRWYFLNDYARWYHTEDAVVQHVFVAELRFDFTMLS